MKVTKGLSKIDIKDLTASKLYNMYIERNMSAGEIARVCGVTVNTIYVRARKYGFHKNASVNYPEGRQLNIKPKDDGSCEELVITTTKKTHCINCVHRGYLGHNGDGNGLICQYILNTGHRRGCPGSNCDKYEKGKMINRRDELF